MDQYTSADAVFEKQIQYFIHSFQACIFREVSTTYGAQRTLISLWGSKGSLFSSGSGIWLLALQCSGRERQVREARKELHKGCASCRYHRRQGRGGVPKLLPVPLQPTASPTVAPEPAKPRMLQPKMMDYLEVAAGSHTPDPTRGPSREGAVLNSRRRAFRKWRVTIEMALF